MPVWPGTPAPGALATPSGAYGLPAPQRSQRGRVYGGPGSPGPGEMTVALPGSPSVENTGSLTGHILAQGWADTPSRSGNAKVIVVLLVSLGIPVLVGLLIILFAGDAFRSLFDGMIGK